MIVVIDYGMGNLHSVCNALSEVGIESKISNQHDEIRVADGLILPGVGSFGDCVQNLKSHDLIDILREQANQGKPFLGICLGMQVLFEKGYEEGVNDGLGLLKGNVVHMNDTSVKIPHIGWNKLEQQQEDSVFDALGYEPFVYYVHSFLVENYDEKDLVGYSNYGTMKIPGYFRKGNILGMQYHPEKSGKDGLKMLEIFKEMCI